MTSRRFVKLTSAPFFLAVSIMMMAGLFLLKIHSLPPQIPLFYSRLEGDDQIADALMIFLLPALVTTMVVSNIFIITKYFAHNDFVRTVTYCVNLSLIAITTFIFVRIIFLVT